MRATTQTAAHPPAPGPRRQVHALDRIQRIVRWYAEVAYGRWEGPGITPFYCVPSRVGPFAVEPAKLAAGSDDALFQLFVTLAMYQSRRDVDVMAIQREMVPREAHAMVKPRRLRLLVESSRCSHLMSAERFDEQCEVTRDFARHRATCPHRPRSSCHVKNATQAIGRMGDMGKIATSAWLHLQADGGGLGRKARMLSETHAPRAAADALVDYLTGFHRVGIKLATMFVSAISTPALAPGLTPWWPRIDGNHLIVVDANVARVVDTLRPRGAGSYRRRAAWLRRIAASLDLHLTDPRLPRTSPRMVQQALYLFRSRSNRIAHGDPCASATRPCGRCEPSVCPFVDRARAAFSQRGGA